MTYENKLIGYKLVLDKKAKEKLKKLKKYKVEISGEGGGLYPAYPTVC